MPFSLKHDVFSRSPKVWYIFMYLPAFAWFSWKTVGKFIPVHPSSYGCLPGFRSSGRPFVSRDATCDGQQPSGSFLRFRGDGTCKAQISSTLRGGRWCHERCQMQGGSIGTSMMKGHFKVNLILEAEEGALPILCQSLFFFEMKYLPHQFGLFFFNCIEWFWSNYSDRKHEFSPQMVV